MRKFIVGCISLAVASTLSFGQGVSISGKVSDPNGVGLPGTVVRLATLALETETDANGYYALGTGVVNVKHLITAKTGAYSTPILSSGKVFFTVAGDNVSVRISAYDLNGRFAADMFSSRLNSGNYSVALDGRNFASQPYILNVNINGLSHAMKFTPVGLRSYSGSISANAGPLSRLEKAMATNDTIKVTKPAYSIVKQAADVSTGTFNFTLTKTSTWNGDTAAFWGNVSTYPTTGVNYVILNRTNGAFPDSKIYWSLQQNGTKVQLSTQNTCKLPNGGGRFYVWVAPTDSNNRYFDFMEHNSNGTTSWLGNTTRVDGWRCPITFRVHTSVAGSKDVVMGDAYSMFYQSRQSKFDEFINENPKEFIGLATRNFANIYAPHTSPTNYFGTGGPYADYFLAYQDTVRAHNPAAPAATTTTNIFACAGTGTMGAQPSYSSAINRHVGHLPAGTNFANWRNPAEYYKAAPCNYFSKWTHRRSIDNKSYGFPYDDFAEQAAFVGAANVLWVAVAIGW
jgi:hypothetical protein